MRILITAGPTFEPIDQVRGVTNRFRGRTGKEIMVAAARQGNDVTLLTSFADSARSALDDELRARIVPYFTYRDLAYAMEAKVCTEKYDVIIHSAAVGDYYVTEVRTDQGAVDASEQGTKIGSNHEELRITMKQTEKLVDKIREPWGFKGTLVKFKLQVGITDEELLTIAHKSMHASHADFIVANCLEWAKERAYILSAQGECVSVARDDLAAELLRRVS